MISSPEQFASLPQARAYVDAVHERIGSLGPAELADALNRIDRAYREFPELALERPRTVSSSLVALLLDRIVRAGGASEPLHALEGGGRTKMSMVTEVVSVLDRFQELHWDDIEPIVSKLRRQGRTDTALEVISAVLERLTFSDNASSACFANVLDSLLADGDPLEIDSGGLIELVIAARRRLNPLFHSGPGAGSRVPLLSMAERLRLTPPPAPPTSDADRAWPSGRLSFDEFLLQWPSEIELPAELDDAAFIEEAFCAILLRGPEIIEHAQYLKSLRDGAVSREWVIEDLLASEELHSLERRLRVVYGGRVITEPGSSGRENMPAVTWPSRPTG
jgi:hypothetical protein